MRGPIAISLPSRHHLARESSLIALVVAVAARYGVPPSTYHDGSRVFSPGVVAATLALLLLPAVPPFFWRSARSLTLRWDFAGAAFALGLALELVTKGALFAAFPGPLTPSFPAGGVPSIWPLYFGWFLFLLVLNSAAEEWVYRVYPLDLLRSHLGARLAVPLTAVAFSLAHFAVEPAAWGPFLYRFGFGVCAGALYERSRSFPGVVAFHTGHNFVALSLSRADWRTGGLIHVSPAPDSVSGVVHFLGLTVAGLVLMLPVRKTTKPLRGPTLGPEAPRA